MMFGDFMLGARSRLLPPSVPFRYFGAAVVLHAAAWLVLALGAEAVPGFAGGTGFAAAGLHLVTLGVLAMTAMGASYQLLPVATRRPMPSVAGCRASSWLFVPGVLALAHGLAWTAPWALGLGGALAVAGLALYLALVAGNLRRVDNMQAAARHAWIALVALAAVLVLGGALVLDLHGPMLADRPRAAAAHALLAGYGFMGMLVFGFSHVLVPMFALSAWPQGRLATVSADLGAVALVLGAAGIFAGQTWLVVLGGAAGLGAAGVHLWLMRGIMAARMKRDLGGSFVLIRLAWALLPVSIIVGILAAIGLVPHVAVPLWGFLLVFGWLLTFVLGVLQRIMPFLASMHSVRPGVPPVLVSALTAEMPLKAHLAAHLGALVLVAAGIVLGAPWLVRLGALAGLAGAVAFAIFAAEVWRRLHRHLKTNQEQRSQTA